MPVNVTATLRKALRQLEAQRARLDRQMFAIRSVLSAGTTSTAASQPLGSRRRRRRMSPEAKRAVSQRMKAYWAKRKTSTVKPKAKGKAKIAKTK
jgi:hypothetical protein